MIRQNCGFANCLGNYSFETEPTTDFYRIDGVMSMPALLVNDKIVSVGKVLKPGEIEKLLG